MKAPIKIPRKAEAAAKAKPSRKFTLTKVHQEKGQSTPFILKVLVVGGCLLALFIIVTCLTNGKGNNGNSASSGVRRDDPRNESIGEWMKRNNIETDLEKQRKAGARKFDR